MSVDGIEQFLATLFQAGLRLSVEGDVLRLEGSKDALTPEIAATIKSKKDEIINFLAAKRSNAPATGGIAPQASINPPLSSAQTRLWFIEQMSQGSAAPTIAFTLEARGKLDLRRVQTALNRIAERHSVLRCRIATRDGRPTQAIVPEARVPVYQETLDHISSEHLLAHLNAAACLPLDLSEAPPLRLHVFTASESLRYLVFAMHHSVADGTSIEILIREFSHFYSHPEAPLAALPVQYGDFAQWQTSQKISDQTRSFWEDMLGQDLPVTQLPTDFPRPAVRRDVGALHPITIDRDTTVALRNIAQRQGTSLFAVTQTAFYILLYRYTGQRDLVVGIPTANRRAETEQLIGLFVNPLPIRAQIDPGASFKENLATIQGLLLNVLEHQDMPFEQLVDRYTPAREPSVSPLFQLKFQLDEAQQASLKLSDLQLRRLPRTAGTAHHDLSLNLSETNGQLQGDFEYSTDLFAPETIAALTDNFGTLLRSIISATDKPISTLDLLPADIRHRQLVTWNESKQPLDPELCFQQMFEAHAAQTPEAIAVEYVADGEIITESYAALNARSNRLAHWLRARGIGAESIIGIALNRSPDLVAAWLAVLKSGAAYLPLDPSYPADRIGYMLQDSGAALVLSQSTIPLPAHIERRDLDQPWPTGHDTNPQMTTQPEDLAYLVYTSGSTGKPKGVLVPHAGLVNLVQDKIRTCDVQPGDRVLNFFSFSFDAVIPEFTMALGSGSRIVLTPAADILPGPGLATLLQQRRITHMTLTPSALLAVPSGDFPDLRMVLVGGEAPPGELIERWAPGRLFINAYGPTETTVNASMVPCGNGHPTEATLLPPANKQLYVLDENLQPLPVGCMGELYIGGVGLARGYHNLPEKTKGAFLPNPFNPGRLYKTGDRALQRPDGRIKVMGRVDNQTKIRGYRIELGEIEQALCEHPDVASAIVTLHEANPGDKRLIAYVVAKETRPDADRFRSAFLATRLPRFLQPDAVVWLDALPITVNSKIDLGALPVPQFGSTGGRPPRGATEVILARIFAELLEIETLSAEDDFFDLGGHSLLTTRLIAAIQDRLGYKIGLLDLFNAPTVAGLAALISGEQTSDKSEQPDALHQDTQEDWQTDLQLDPEIHGTAATTMSLPDRIFLTGGTGFLGPFLVAELLQNPARNIWCLTRDGTLDRIRTALQGRGLWQDSWRARLHPVKGDLTQPRLGLSDQDYADVTATADAIFHCAAEVHHMKPYRALRSANVQGTVELLRLTTARPGRMFHYLSTLSAFATQDETKIVETDRMAHFRAPDGGYNQSKYVAERLVQQAADRDVPVTIYRIGSVSGHSETGAFNAADILARLIQGYLTSGMAPKGRTLINMLPVDFAAQLIVRLAETAAGRTHHITHNQPVSSDLLFAACAAEGFDIRRVSAQDWRNHLDQIARSAPDHPLFALAEIAAHFQATLVWPFDCTQTFNAAMLTPPPLSEHLFRTYLQAFVRAGASPHPAQLPAQKEPIS